MELPRSRMASDSSNTAALLEEDQRLDTNSAHKVITKTARMVRGGRRTSALVETAGHKLTTLKPASRCASRGMLRHEGHAGGATLKEPASVIANTLL